MILYFYYRSKTELRCNLMNNDSISKKTVSDTNDIELKKSLGKFRKTLFVIIAVAVTAIIIALIYFFSTINNILSDPIVRFVSATQKTFTAYSATINATLENTTTKGTAEINGSYEINPHEKQLSAEFDVTSKALTDKNSPETKINIIVRCENDGGVITYTKDNKVSDFEINESTAKRFFDTFSDAESMGAENLNCDWGKLINEAGLQDYVNSDEIEGALLAIYTELSSDEGRNLALGITETKKDGKDIIHFELDPYRTANIILENGKPVLKNSKDYDKYRTFIEDYKSFLNSILIKFDVTISDDGYINEINAENLGVIINIKISDINNAKTEMSIADGSKSQ